MLKIGIDFDNTIACYEEIFYKIIQKKGLELTANRTNKDILKNYLCITLKNENLWKKIQGEVYGKNIHEAKIFPGLLLFLLRSLIKGNSIYIISHKTKYGHFDINKINLQNAALEWLNNNLLIFLDGLQFSISKNIYFCTTRTKKIKKISELNLDFFIDDLIEIYQDPVFPKKTKSILFNKKNIESKININYISNSWNDISDYIYGPIENAEIIKILKIKFSVLNITQLTPISKGKNSKVFKIISSDSSIYLLKTYPDLAWDSRPRLETEKNASKLLLDAGLNVPVIVAFNKSLNWAIYKWVNGKNVKVNELFLKESLNFINAAQSASNIKNLLLNFPKASEACLSIDDYREQIDSRIESYLSLNIVNLNNFLQVELIPTYKKILIEASNVLDNTDLFISKQYQILSPSDFGSHNAMIDPSGKYYFYDFEYFGWDDPVKFVADFYWHPAMELNNNLREKWLSLCLNNFSKDPNFKLRLKLCLPLIGIRWCLIILKEYQKINKNELNYANYQSILLNSLRKSEKLLREVKKQNTIF